MPLVKVIVNGSTDITPFDDFITGFIEPLFELGEYGDDFFLAQLITRLRGKLFISSLAFYFI
jgi:hypothetical protein